MPLGYLCPTLELWYNRPLSGPGPTSRDKQQEIGVFNPINALLGLFSLDIGIDLGTANTLVSVRNKGIIINEPSWVAINKRTKRPLAIGAEAKEMVGRTPSHIVAIRPLRDGVISEFEITEAMLDYFIKKAHENKLVPVPRPRVVVGIPSGVTEVEKRAVYDAALSAGAREAFDRGAHGRGYWCGVADY